MIVRQLTPGSKFTNEFGSWMVISRGPGGTIIRPTGKIRKVVVPTDGRPAVEFDQPQSTQWVSDETPVNVVLNIGPTPDLSD